MPLDTLTSPTAPITLSILDEEIHAHYYPRRITGADLRLLQHAADVIRADDTTTETVLAVLDEAAEMLARVLADWDFRETTDGPFVPLTPESLVSLGPLLLTALTGSFIRGMSLGKTNGNGSPVRSQPTRTNRSRKSSRRG